MLPASGCCVCLPERQLVSRRALSHLPGPSPDDGSSVPLHLIYGGVGKAARHDGASRLPAFTGTQQVPFSQKRRAIVRIVSCHQAHRLTLPDLLNPNLDKVEEETAGTSLEALTSRPRRQQSREAAVLASAANAVSTENASTTAEPNTPSAAQDLEDEADQQGAFNPETGEINWDCPCLGGMAHGPCGPQFREAFSCFVYSTEEPKGMDCIEKFQGMQDCFKEHPDVYKGELDDEANEGEYDETMAAEKEELAKEIKERRLKMGVEADGSKRILEESSTPAKELKPKEPKPKKEKGKKPTAGDEGSALKPKAEAKANDSRSSQTLQEPNIDEVFPKAAHDAMNAKVPQTEK